MTMNKGLLVVFSGPSGAGKDTILRSLLECNPNIRLSVSATTRAPREGEQDGKDYYFVSKEAFQKMQQNHEMLESAEYCGNCYGTPRAPIERWQGEGKDVILEIEVQGGAQIKEKVPECVSIFILPPSVQILEHRLRSRNTETEDAIQKRLLTAKEEIKQAYQYDYIVINDTIEQAVEQINYILSSEKQRVCRSEDTIERVLNLC